MKHTNDNLVQESIHEENDFSSTTHAIDTLAHDAPKENIIDYPIPHQYNKDRLTLLPINQSTYYLYWEISDDTLKSHNIDLNDQKLHFRVQDSNNNTLYNFDSSFALSEYFLNQNFENSDIYAEVGYILDNKFIGLFKSNPIHTFSSQIHFPTSESEIWIQKKKSWSEIIRTTLEHSHDGSSSAKYIEELERLKYFSTMDEEQLSSSTLHKGKSND
ncbi:MAG: DUF4912 domain-containing protein [Campylobacterota bacterium]|nr:DUF4912 domain-containing protein [Campylobacterota bacterium]